MYRANVLSLACLALLSSAALGLETAVNPGDATPEPEGVPINRAVSRGLSSLWKGKGSKQVVEAPAPEHTSFKVAEYSDHIKQLTRVSSEKATAAWKCAVVWAEQPRVASLAAFEYAEAQAKLLALWWRHEKIDLLRDPWRSGLVLSRAATHCTHTAAAETWKFSTSAIAHFWALVRPGGKLHPEGFLESKGHLVVEGGLIAILMLVLLQRSYKPGRSGLAAERLTDKEIDELCEDWKPEPLAAPVPVERQHIDPPIISSDVGREVVADGRKVLNFSSQNFLGFAADPEIRDICKRTIEKYGVGACGPRGFYGTIDVHLELEQRLASFMGTEEAILYSYDMATVPSILPAFANKRDLIICDEAASFPIQNGAMLSRARVLYFKHNDVTDLERVLQKVAQEDCRHKKPLNRRYIVVEGIYINTGDVAPLAAIAQLKHKYKYRLLVDESYSLGVLGQKGRGAFEAAGLKSPGDVDIISSSLGNSLASIGGFCAGSREIVDHQRLSGLGYCFSAALPPYLATAASGAIEKLRAEGAQLQGQLGSSAGRLRKLLSDAPGLQLVGGPQDAVSPVLHLRLAKPATTAATVLRVSQGGIVAQFGSRASTAEGEAVLAEVAANVLKRDGVLIAVHRLATNDRCSALGAAALPPSLRVCVSAAHTTQDIERAAAAIRHAAALVLRLPEEQQQQQQRRQQPQRNSSATL